MGFMSGKGSSMATISTMPATAAKTTAGGPASAPYSAARAERARLEFTPALAREMEPLYARVKHVVTPMEWVHTPRLSRRSTS